MKPHAKRVRIRQFIVEYAVALAEEAGPALVCCMADMRGVQWWQFVLAPIAGRMAAGRRCHRCPLSSGEKSTACRVRSQPRRRVLDYSGATLAAVAFYGDSALDLPSFACHASSSSRLRHMQQLRAQAWHCSLRCRVLSPCRNQPQDLVPRCIMMPSPPSPITPGPAANASRACDDEQQWITVKHRHRSSEVALAAVPIPTVRLHLPHPRTLQQRQ
jgi:hypothetical protein